MASRPAALMRAANNNRRTCLIGAPRAWAPPCGGAVRGNWRTRARRAGGGARIRDERRRRDDAQRERRRRRRRARARAPTRCRRPARRRARSATRRRAATAGSSRGRSSPSTKCQGRRSRSGPSASSWTQLKNFMDLLFRCRDAVCVAHGTQPGPSGWSLSECLRRTRNDSIDGQELHGRFCEAASVDGGSWVEYACVRRTASLTVKDEGRSGFRVTARTATTCMGVGFAVLAAHSSTFGRIIWVRGERRREDRGARWVRRWWARSPTLATSTINEVDGAELTRRIVGAGNGAAAGCLPLAEPGLGYVKGQGLLRGAAGRGAGHGLGRCSSWGASCRRGESDEALAEEGREVGGDNCAAAGRARARTPAHAAAQIPPSPEAARAPSSRWSRRAGRGCTWRAP